MADLTKHIEYVDKTQKEIAALRLALEEKDQKLQVIETVTHKGAEKFHEAVASGDEKAIVFSSREDALASLVNLTAKKALAIQPSPAAAGKIVEALRNFVNAFEQYKETGVFPGHFDLCVWAEEGKEALRLLREPK